MSNGAAGAGAAAAAAAAKRRQEEEEMTRYTDEELAGDWEFKILRSVTGAFRKPETLRKACEEEAQAGWTLVEKFDNDRLRFKRPASARANDASLAVDPYRTQYGIGTGAFVAIIVAASLAAIGVLVAILKASGL